MQGVHQLASRRAGGGTDTLPVLVGEEGVLAESEEIVRCADAHLPPERRLFPDGADGRASRSAAGSTRGSAPTGAA